MKFYVTVPEVYYQGYEVEAESKEEAIKIIADGGGDLIEGDFEYSHTVDDLGTWHVES